MSSDNNAAKTLTDVLDIISDGVWDWNANTGHVDRNPAWYRMLGHEVDCFNKDVLTWENVIHPEDYPGVMEHFEHYINGTIPEYRIQYRCVRAVGSYLWIEDSGKIVERNPDGTVARMIGAHTNINELKAAQQQIAEMSRLLGDDAESIEAITKERVTELATLNTKLEEKIRQVEHIATHDALTGVFNRGMFEQLLDIEIKRAKRYGHPLSVILADIDHFKRINDRYGHSMGDQVLEKVASHFTGHIREGDALARWGGEEFAIILPNTNTAKGIEMAERLRLEVEASDMIPELTITCSFGVTTFKRSDSPQTLFSRMDKALYKAKELNRNNVQLL